MSRSSAKWVIVSLASVVALPHLARAAGQSFHDLVYGPILKLGNQVIALLYALSFLMFLVGIVRFFFSQSAEGRQKGKLFALYSIIGLVVLFAVWGFVRALLSVLTGFNT